MTNPSSAKTYAIYLGFEGEPRSQWQFKGKPTVPGCTVSSTGCYPPPFQWVVRAFNVKQAYALVYDSVTSESDPDELGIWWNLDDQDPEAPQPPPLGKNLDQFWGIVAYCGGVTVVLFPTKAEAERRMSLMSARDGKGCCGICRGDHELRLLTVDQVERMKTAWWDGVEEQDDPF